jgi:hypothetical protein
VVVYLVYYYFVLFCELPVCFVKKFLLCLVVQKVRLEKIRYFNKIHYKIKTEM